MLKALIDFLLNRKGNPVEAAAPYKVETPEPKKCGCGRSPTGYCIGHHALSDETWATHPDNKTKAKVEVTSDGNWPFPKPVAEKKPAVKAKSVHAKKAPAAAITAAEKPKKATKAKAPAKPRAKKAKE